MEKFKENKEIEKNINEVLELIEKEVDPDDKVMCTWGSNYVDIDIINEKENLNYADIRIFDDGLYSVGNDRYYNFEHILDNYFVNVENMFDNKEFEDLLLFDNKETFDEMSKDNQEYCFTLSREFESKLEENSLNLNIHDGLNIYSLYKDVKTNEWNLEKMVENVVESNIKGSYKECLDTLITQVKYEDILLELARQGEMININNFNENGEKEGLWVIPKEDEWIKEEICFYEKGKLNGKYAKIFTNAEVAEVGTYKDNLKEGESFKYDIETLRLKEVKSYIHDIPNGPYRAYIYTGELESEGTYIDGNLHGEYRSYQTDENDNLFLWQISNYENGLEQGKVTNFYPGGQIETEFYMRDGEIEGKCISYFENGNIKEIEEYAKSRLYGLKTTYYENGETKEATYYFDNYIHGSKTEYLDNGSKFKESYYKDGVLTKAYHYKKDKLESVENYAFGKRVERKTYDENFSLVIHSIYKDDIEHFKGYYPNGNLKIKVQFKDNLFFGENKYYYENGNIREIVNYRIQEMKDNKLALKDGEYKQYYENGNIKESGTYKDDKKEGLWLNYSRNQRNEIIKESTYKSGELVKSIELKKEVSKERTPRSRARSKGNER